MSEIHESAKAEVVGDDSDVTWFDDCGSTNDEILGVMSRDGRYRIGTMVVSDHQSAGRGRSGREWYSPCGGLYASIAVAGSSPASAVSGLTLAAGVGVRDALNSIGARCTLKWPNDVIAAGKKVGGILTEVKHVDGHCVTVVGVGINVNCSVLPDGATALRDYLLMRPTDEIDLARLALRIRREVLRQVADATRLGLAEVVRRWVPYMDHVCWVTATVDGKKITGRQHGMDRDGSVILIDSDGVTHVVRGGDVSIA